jgi:chemotaxis response regulator CheB
MSERLVEILSDIREIEIVGQARDVPEAIDSIRRLKPDVVISDIGIPGGNGPDVLKNTKRDDPATTVIICLPTIPFMDTGRNVQIWERISFLINRANFRRLLRW